ncbi:serine hydrolase [Patescibacteria group bacterium]|nr:serine hydrolase [Patescibacteria group bacterium]
MKIETIKVRTRGFKGRSFKIFIFLLIFAVLVLGSLKLAQVIRGYIFYKITEASNNSSAINQAIDYSFLKPFRNWEVKGLEEIDALSAVSMVINSHEEKIVFEKNSDEMLHIASLSKIMTAYVALKNYELSDSIVITQKIVETEENKGDFKVGERLTVEELLASMLIESSNDAAMAIAEIMGESKFISLMNEEAKILGLEHTYFMDPIGLDPDNGIGENNYSTARELALLIQQILKESRDNPKIAKIIEIMNKEEYDIVLTNGNFHHKAISTNKILDEFPNMIAAKTGQTPKAKQCFLVILPKPKGDGYLINVILGSNDRFGEIKKIINWLNKAFVW